MLVATTDPLPTPLSPGRQQQGRVGGTWQRWLTIAVSVVVLVGTIWMVGARSLWDRLRGLEGGWLAVAFAITVLQFLLMAARWSFIANRVGVPLRYGRALGEYYLSVLLNSVLPIGVVGDVLRAFRHADHAAPPPLKRPVAATVLAIVLERGSGQLALWLVVLAVAPDWWRAVSAATARSGGRVGLVLAVAVVGLVAICVFGRRRLARLREVTVAGGRLFFKPSNLVVHLAISFLLLATHVLLFMAAAQAIRLEISFEAAVRIVPPILVASTFLAFFGGFGTPGRRRRRALCPGRRLCRRRGGDLVRVRGGLGAGRPARHPGITLAVRPPDGDRPSTRCRATTAAAMRSCSERRQS
jgi:glycosyltransferase 2 family protein